MPVFLPVIAGKISLVIAGCDDRFVRHADRAKQRIRRKRIGDADCPCAAVRFAAERLHIAAKIDDRR